MQACVLAAGEGSRLSPHFGGLPKPLVPILGVPMIDWLLLQLEELGFTDVSIVIREQHVAVAEHLKHAPSNLGLHVVRRDTPGGMYSLFALQPTVVEDDFFMFTVDNIFDPRELRSFVEARTRFCGRTLTSWITPRKMRSQGEVGVVVDETLRILELGKHLLDTALIAEGPYHCNTSVFAEREAAERSSITRLSDYLHFLLLRDYVMYGYQVPCVLDVDDRRDYDQAIDFLQRLLPPGPSKVR